MNQNNQKKPSRTAVFQLLKIIVVGILIAFIIKHNGGPRMLSLTRQANIFWLLISAFSFYASLLLGSYQWYILLRFQNIPVSFSNCYKIYHLGMFANAIVFNLAGDALRVYKLKKGNTELASGVVATFLDRFNGFLVLSVFSLIASIIIWSQQLLDAQSTLVVLSCSWLVFLCFGAGTLTIISRRIGRFFINILEKIKLLKLVHFFRQIQDCLLLYRNHWKGMLGLLAVAGGIHGLRIAGHAFCAPALGIEISPLYFFAFIPIISIVTLFPLNVGGWGLPQGIATLLYSIPGVIGTLHYGLDSQAEGMEAAVGALAFLPAVIFYFIMLLGGFFFSTQIQLPNE